MDVFEKHWNEAHGQDRFRPKYPSEFVVRFMNACFSKNYKLREKTKILDIGCGGGRHVKLFAENGFRTYGVDFSGEGIEQTKKVLSEHGLNAELKICDMRELPYDDAFFDGVISFGVFYYADANGMRDSIGELCRVLKTKAAGFVNLRTTDDYRYGKGKEIERNTFVLGIEETNEVNLTMHFLSLQDVHDYFKKVSLINIEKNEFTSNNLKVLNSDWLITVVK